MKNQLMFRLLFLSITLMAILLFLTPISSATGGAGELSQRLESAGVIGPKAIDVKVSTDVSGNEKGDKNAPVSVKLTPVERAYITAIYISPGGDAVVVFPNKKTPDNLAAPGKDCTIVSPDCGLKIGFSQSQDKGRILVYVSANPMSLDPLKPAGEDDFITISSDDSKNLEMLTSKLAAISKDERFNLKVITPDKLSKPGQGDSLMGLPAGVASSHPESVAGVQGIKGKIKELAK
jgi:hypothetical protein